MLAVRKLVRGVSTIAGSSIFWGGLAALGFYALVHSGALHGEFLKRYFTAHWTLYLETILFFIGVAELLLKSFDTGEQNARLGTPLLPPIEASPLAADEARPLIDHLAALPPKLQQGYLPRRLRESLESICRKGSADSLDEELKYLSEVDAARAHGGYALMRILIWAIPILGFLGTVIGITMAIGSLNPKNLEASLDEVTFGLGVAFDTTALALVLSMALMFGQFLLDRLESALLEKVDSRATLELAGRFQRLGTSRDPQIMAISRMSETVLAATEGLVQKQAELWQKTIDVAHRRWSELTSSGQQQIEAALVKSLGRSVQSHAEHLALAEAQAAERNRRHWNRVHKALVESTHTAQAQHIELVRQGEVLLQVVEATGQVGKLEDALNRNLASLGGSKHLQETLLNLGAAIQLLNARLAQLTPLAPHIELKEHNVGRAA
jgi:biopolymer transport protein ExbB/TolQ